MTRQIINKKATKNSIISAHGFIFFLLTCGNEWREHWITKFNATLFAFRLSNVLSWNGLSFWHLFSCLCVSNGFQFDECTIFFSSFNNQNLLWISFFSSQLWMIFMPRDKVKGKHGMKLRNVNEMWVHKCAR